MGLCLGFSGLSAIEVIYFLTLRAWCRKRRKRAIGARVAKKFREIWIKVKGLRTYGVEVDGGKRKGNDGGGGRPSFVPRRHNVSQLPTVSSSESVTALKKSLSFDDTSSLPSYNSIINEISPFYSKKYWSVLEMNRRP
jgi:hypothetical protein